jgi:Kef-type K+ transport system membrane component KefB
MFMSPLGLLVILMIHAVIGTTISTVVILALLRRTATWRLMATAAVISTAVWLLTIHLSDEAGVSGYPSNGKWEVLPWRENTHWQNFLGDHPYAIASVSSALATILVVRVSRNWKKRSINRAIQT